MATFDSYKTKANPIGCIIEREKSLGMGAWLINKTPLKDYALPPNTNIFNRKKRTKSRLNCEEFLVQEIAKSSEKGEVLSCLDIGVGAGTAWGKPLARYGGKFILSATTLSDCDGIWGGIKPMLTFTNAASMHLHYPKESFDMVISHYGLHHELGLAFPAIISLLKKGGNALLSGCGPAIPDTVHDSKDFHSYSHIISCGHGSNFNIVKSHQHDLSSNMEDWFLWVQKTG